MSSKNMTLMYGVIIGIVGYVLYCKYAHKGTM